MAGVPSGSKPKLEFCKLELCPAKRKCLRNPAAGVVSHDALDEAFGRLAILPGEQRCPHYVGMSHKERYFGSPEPVVAPPDGNDPLYWVDELEALLRKGGFPPKTGSLWTSLMTEQLLTLHDRALELIAMAKELRELKANGRHKA